MSILHKTFYLISFLSLSLGPLMGMQGNPGQFKPQDIDAILNSMTEEDFNNILNELAQLSPQELEELEKIGRQVLIDSGIDPDTGKPLEHNPPAPPAPASEAISPEPFKPADVQPRIKTHSVDNVHNILETIIKNINTLRQKSQGNDQIARRLSQWADTLNDLIFYVRVINKKEHHERLATKDFDTLFKDLEVVSRQLAIHQPHISLPQSSAEDDPYRLMGIPYTASSQEINDAYANLKNKYDAKKIRSNLRKQKASQKEIDREVRAAKLTFSLIQDAYDQLHDKKTKALLDEKRLTQTADQLSSISQNALTHVLEAISNAIYQQKLLDQLQDFLKKYEPEQLAQKQALEAAQVQRKKEQEELAKAKPALTTGKYDKTYQQHAHRPSSYNEGYYRGGGYYPSYNSSSSGGNYRPSQHPQTTEQPKKESGSASRGQSSKPTAKNEPDEKTKELMSQAAKKAEADKKKASEKREKALEERIKKLESLEHPLAAPSTAPLTTKSAPRSLSPDIKSTIDLSELDLACENFKNKLNSPESKRLFRKMEYRGGANPMLDQNEIMFFHDNTLAGIIEQLDKILTKMSTGAPIDWDSRIEKYSDTFTRFKNSLNQEECKYKKINSPLPQALAQLITQTDSLIRLFNTISQNTVKRTPINPTSLCIEDMPDDDMGLKLLFGED